MRASRAVISAISIMCAAGHGLAAQADTIGHRVFFQGTWRGGSIGRHVVAPDARPELQVAGSNAFYVYDYAGHELRALDMTGRVVWSSAGSDGPPPQFGFANPSDMKVDAANRLWVDDPYTGFVFVLSDRGAVTRRISALRSAERIVLRPGSGFWLWDEAIRGGGFTMFGSDGNRAGQVSFREGKTGIDTLPPIERVPLLASAQGGIGPIVQTFLWSSDFLLWTPPNPKPLECHGIEPLSFPVILSWNGSGQQHFRMTPGATRGALATVVDDSLIYILFGGTTKYRDRVIDTYSLKSGRYVGSYLLPEPVVSMSRLNGKFVTTTTRPAAGVQIWSWVPTRTRTSDR